METLALGQKFRAMDVPEPKPVMRTKHEERECEHCEHVLKEHAMLELKKILWESKYYGSE